MRFAVQTIHRRYGWSTSSDLRANGLGNITSMLSAPTSAADAGPKTTATNVRGKNATESSSDEVMGMLCRSTTIPSRAKAARTHHSGFAIGANSVVAQVMTLAPAKA